MQINKIVSSLILGGFFALTGSVSIAAENAAGVAEHFKMTVDTTKEALSHAKEGNEHACLSSIKSAKQHYKEITGDAAGKPLQDAMKRMKDAQAECEKEGGAPKAAEILTEVVAALEKIRSK
ncbi:MAG: hypothetical protein FIB02_05020 [Desulfuromonas sp.]|nr:hypothetical protein [Desulfuromonas sp.]